MHHQRGRRHGREPVGVQAVPAGVLPLRGEERSRHPLPLDPQHDDDIAFGQHRVQIVGDRDRPSLDPDGHQRGRGDHRHGRPQGRQQPHVGPGHPRVQDVADDRDGQAVETTEPTPDGERVEQRLGRMLMGAVPGVDHAAAHPPGKPARSPAGRVPAHHRVRAHRLEGERGVLEAFSLGDARTAG